VARRITWLIDMGDGTWAVSCLACRIALYRGPKGWRRARRRPPLLRTRPPLGPPAPAGLTTHPRLW
jgi:hypothetical protein